jgi:hypothetical protein
MLTEKEINQLIEAQKKVFPVKADLESLKFEMRKEMKEEIDELARIVEKGFDGAQKHMDERFDKIESLNHEIRIKRMEDALVIK